MRNLFDNSHTLKSGLRRNEHPIKEAPRSQKRKSKREHFRNEEKILCSIRCAFLARFFLSCLFLFRSLLFSDVTFVRNTNGSCYRGATLKTYPLLIIMEADAIPCVIVLSVSVRHVSCIFLLVNTYTRFIVFVSQNLHRAYERFTYFCKKWRQSHGVGL